MKVQIATQEPFITDIVTVCYVFSVPHNMTRNFLKDELIAYYCVKSC